MQALEGKRKPVYPSHAPAIAARMGGFGGLDHDSSALLCARGLMEVQGGFTWRTGARLRLTSSMRLTEAQVEGFLRAIKAPTLLIVGEHGMGGTGMFDHRVAWVADIRVMQLAGRHHLHMEQPQPVAAEITGFIQGA